MLWNWKHRHKVYLYKSINRIIIVALVIWCLIFEWSKLMQWKKKHLNNSINLSLDHMQSNGMNSDWYHSIKLHSNALYLMTHELNEWIANHITLLYSYLWNAASITLGFSVASLFGVVILILRLVGEFVDSWWACSGNAIRKEKKSVNRSDRNIKTCKLNFITFSTTSPFEQFSVRLNEVWKKELTRRICKLLWHLHAAVIDNKIDERNFD